MSISRRDLLISAAALFPLRAQEKPDATFAGGVKVVNVFASVHNGKNEVVKDLKQDDFTIEEDGRPQVIKYFARETDLPLSLGLMVDTSGSQRRVLDQEKTATSEFISQVMREDKDKAFLIKFDAEAEEMQELTSSKKKLQSALNDVEGASPRQLQRRNDPNSGGYPSGGGGNQRAGTILYDAILLASNEEMKKLQGRKAMILLTDGDDHGSRSSLSECIESAQRADTIIYSIYFADQEQSNYSPGFGGPGMGRHGGGGGGRRPQQVSRGDGKKILQRISKETGGSFFEVTKKMPIDKIYQQIEEELRSQYNLGYTPDKSDAGSGFRKIKVTAKGKGLVVEARDGYYATT
jgi:VWFA-related protein